MRDSVYGGWIARLLDIEASDFTLEHSFHSDWIDSLVAVGLRNWVAMKLCTLGLMSLDELVDMVAKRSELVSATVPTEQD